MKNKIIIACILMLITINTATANAAEVIDKIIAKVDGEIITLYELNKMRISIRAYKGMYAIYKNFETEEEKNLFLLDMLINDMLIIKEIENNEMIASDSDVEAAINDIAAQNSMKLDEFMQNVASQGLSERDYKDMIKKQIEKMRFYSKFINSKVHVTDKEVLTFFREKKEFFKRNQLVVFDHILFSRKDGNKKEALKLATDFLATFKESGSINEAVKPLLDNENVKITPDISMKKVDLSDEFKGPINGMTEGSVSEIIENSLGYSIIALKKMETITLDSFKERIRTAILQEKRDKTYRSMLSKLRQEHSIEKRL